MNRTFKILGGLLVAQVLLAAVLWGVNRPQSKTAEPLLNIDPAAVDQIEIADADKTVELVLKEGRWQLPALADLPAAAGKVRQLIEKLAGFKPDWPETTTAASHQRFELAEDHFQRRIKLASAGQMQADLLVGTSPGFRKSHVRKAGDDAVYALEISAFDLPTQAVDWLDKHLLAVSELSRIQGPDYALWQQDGIWQWHVEQWPDGAAPESDRLDASKAVELAGALSSLSVLMPADPQEIPDTALTLSVQGQDDRVYRYRFWKQGEAHYVRRDDVAKTFVFSAFDFKRIAEITQAELVQVQQPSEPSEAGA
ncbi:MAG: DUF4340 domain-containing protein [Methylococcales bacterium]|nr:DUF4340 domain-containing protein [Methylococcales bacterium]